MNYRFFSQAVRQRFFPLPLSLALCGGLAGCGGGGGGSSPSTTAPVVTPTPPPTPTPPAPVTMQSAPALQNFTVTLVEDKTTVAVGGTVNYTLTLTNTSASTATVIVTSVNGQAVPQAALYVTNPSGATVYPVARPGVAHDNPPPAPPILNMPVALAPGQSLTAITRPVSAFSTAGTYQAVATFTVAATYADAPQTVTLPALAVTAQ